MRSPLCAALALALVPMPAAAQRTPLIIDRDRIDRTTAPPVPTPPGGHQVPGTGRAESQTAGAPATALASVTVAGTTIDRAAFETAWRPFVGTPLSLETIGAIADAVGRVYAQSDAALYTILVPEQDFAVGVLRIRVVEGHVAGVVVDDDHGRVPSKLVRRIAAALLRETPLRRATLERTMSLLRDVPGLTVEPRFLPSRSPDAVRLGLKIRQKRIDLTFSADNRGTALLGAFQYQAQATANTLLRDGDQTQLTLASSGDLKRYRYASLSHSTPLGANGTRLSANVGYLRTSPETTPIEGEARLAGVQLSHPVIRGFKRNLTATLAVDGIDSDNAAFGSLIAREHSRAGRASVGWSAVGAKDVTGASLTVSRGLDILSADNPGGLVDLTFTKVNGRVTYDRAIGKSFGLHLKAAGQYSQDRLPSVETFTLGGDEFGRAFRYAALLGDKGIAAAAELGWVPQKGLPKPLAGSTLYGFVDGGTLRLNPRGAFTGRTYSLTSAGAGVRVALWGKGYVGLEEARALSAPASLDGGWKTVVSWRLSLR